LHHLKEPSDVFSLSFAPQYHQAAPPSLLLLLLLLLPLLLPLALRVFFCNPGLGKEAEEKKIAGSSAELEPTQSPTKKQTGSGGRFNCHNNNLPYKKKCRQH